MGTDREEEDPVLLYVWKPRQLSELSRAVGLQ
jgi:hypothetical protein